MKRRELFHLVITGSAVGAPAAATSFAASQTTGLSPAAAAEMMRAYGITPSRGEAAQVAMFLQSTRRRRSSDPRVEPAIRLETDIDPGPS